MRKTITSDGFFVAVNQSGELRTFEYVSEEEVISEGFSILRKANNPEILKGYMDQYVRRNTAFIVSVKDGKLEMIEQLGPHFKAPIGAEIKGIFSEKETAEAFMEKLNKHVV